MTSVGFFAERARNLRYAATTARMNGATQSALVYDARADLAEAYAVRAARSRGTGVSRKGDEPATVRSGKAGGWCPIT